MTYQITPSQSNINTSVESIKWSGFDKRAEAFEVGERKVVGLDDCLRSNVKKD